MKRTLPNELLFSQARDLLRAGECVTLRVLGQSMLPFFASGSRITLRPLRTEDLRPGRVVLARTAQGHYVVHRILHVAPDVVTLLGDGNLTPERVAPDRIYGTVDCGRLHLALARLWQWMRPLRRYPLAVLHRICRK